MSARPTQGWSRRRFLAGGGAAAAGLTLAPRIGRGIEAPRLNFYNWDSYIGATTLADFKRASGIDVRLSLFADNDELFATLARGNPGYDVIVATNDTVERMIAAGMLLPVNRALLVNFKNIDPAFRDAPFDPGRRFSVPYMWGTQGIGFRKSAVRPAPDSWKVLLESDRHAGRVALLDDAASVLGAALKYLGYSYNATAAAEVGRAADLVIRQKPHVKLLAEDAGRRLLLSGEVDLAMAWNGDMLQAMEQDGDLSYVVPREGGLLWQDCLCIPRGAAHPENAHKFVNFILDAAVGAAIAEFIYYATPNRAARARLPAAYNRHPVIFPDAPTRARCEPAAYRSGDAARLYAEAWNRILAA